MFDIVRRYADDVEEYSIDECFADLTGLDSTLKMTYLEIAEHIKYEVNKELGLSISIGLAPTKVLAKVASKYVKPNGLTVISTKDAPDFLEKTSIEKIWGIGPKTSDFLKKKRIQTALEFSKKDIQWITKNLSKPYETIWKELNCIRVMDIDTEPKTIYSSIQKTRSFHPSTNDKTFLLSEFSKNIEDACKKARHYKLFPKKISFFLKTQDFKYSIFSTTMTTPTNAPEAILALVKKYLCEMYVSGVLYRTTGVTLQDLALASELQGDLFGGMNNAKRMELIYEQIDHLEDKFGKRLIYLGSTHSALERRIKGTNSDDLERDLLFLKH